MKFISGFFKIIAFIIMSFVILLLPITLFAHNVGEVLFSRNVISEIIEENFFNEEVLTTIAEDMIESYTLPEVASEEASAIPGMLFDSIKNLERDQLLEIFQRTIPSDLISETFNSVINKFYDWLEADIPFPEIVIDVRPWKNNTLENIVPVIEIVLDALPNCTDEQINGFVINLGLNLIQVSETPSIPKCNPPEPYYSLIIENGTKVLPTMFESFPDEVDLSGQFVSMESDLQALKQTINSTRFILQWGWLVVLGLFLFALPMGSRTIPQLFKWAGGPLILSGGLIFMMMLSINIFSPRLIEYLLPFFSAQIPGLAISFFNPVLETLLEIFVTPLRNQGLILFVTGILLFIIGMVIGRNKKTKLNNTHGSEPIIPPDFDSMKISAISPETVEPESTKTEIDT